jgi:hypothetical protein
MGLGEGGGTQNVPIWEREPLGRFVASSERPGQREEGLHVTFRIALSHAGMSALRVQAWPVSRRLILSPVTWKAPEGGHHCPGVVAVRGEEIEPIFFSLSTARWPCAVKISRSIRSRSDRGLPSSVSVAFGVSVVSALLPSRPPDQFGPPPTATRMPSP